MGYGGPAPFAFARPSPQPRHLHRRAGLVDEDQPFRSEPCLAFEPEPAPREHVRAPLLRCMAGLFLCVSPRLAKKCQTRRRAHPNPVRRRQLLANLGQRHSLGLRHQSQDKGLMRIQLRARRLALAVGLDRARLAPAPVPVDRRRWRDTKTRRGPRADRPPVTASTTRRRRSFP